MANSPPSKRRRKREIIKTEKKETEEYTNKLSDAEKIDLYNALIQHGSSDKTLLSSFVSTKTEETIRYFIGNYKRFARVSLKGEDKTRSAPIDKWLNYLIQNIGKDKDKLKDLSRTLKYIALFDSRVKIDPILRDCYILLSDCLKGESPKHLNPETSFFLLENIQQLIRTLKNENHDKELKFLENLNKKVACYSIKNTVTDAQTKMDPRISNPLNIPDFLLEIKK